MRIWRRRKETLGVFSLYARRYKNVYISLNNNTNLNLFKILSNYIIWDRLSQKTISGYCPFNGNLSVWDQGGLQECHTTGTCGGGPSVWPPRLKWSKLLKFYILIYVYFKWNWCNNLQAEFGINVEIWSIYVFFQYKLCQNLLCVSTLFITWF